MGQLHRVAAAEDGRAAAAAGRQARETPAACSAGQSACSRSRGHVELPEAVLPEVDDRQMARDGVEVAAEDLDRLDGLDRRQSRRRSAPGCRPCRRWACCPAAGTRATGSAGRPSRRAGWSSFAPRRPRSRRRPRASRGWTAASLSRKRVSKLSVPSSDHVDAARKALDIRRVDVGDDRLDVDRGVDRRAVSRRRRPPWAARRRRPLRRRASGGAGCSVRRNRDRRSAPCPRRRGPGCWPAVLPRRPQPQTRAAALHEPALARFAQRCEAHLRRVTVG